MRNRQSFMQNRFCSADYHDSIIATNNDILQCCMQLTEYELINNRSDSFCG